jgi:hypothetical protein
MFVPVAIETFGAFGDEASVFIQDIAQLILAAARESRSAEFLSQQLSVDIQQGNAACVLGTWPNRPATITTVMPIAQFNSVFRPR